MALDTIGREQTAQATSSKLEELLLQSTPTSLLKKIKASPTWQEHAKKHRQADIVDVDLSQRTQASDEKKPSSEQDAPSSPVHLQRHEQLAQQGDTGGAYLTGKPIPVTCSCGTQIDVVLGKEKSLSDSSTGAEYTTTTQSGQLTRSTTKALTEDLTATTYMTDAQGPQLTELERKKRLYR